MGGVIIDMKKYKPEYLGKVIPVDNQDKLTDFVQNKYNSFSKIYDICKDHSENISDISTIDTGEIGSKELSINISTDEKTINSIKEEIKGNGVKIENDVIMALDDD
jgi:hypothetical protein